MTCHPVPGWCHTPLTTPVGHTRGPQKGIASRKPAHRAAVAAWWSGGSCSLKVMLCEEGDGDGDGDGDW